VKTYLYGVFDAAAKAYLSPFFSASDGVAKRAFHHACNTGGHDFFLHASDYTLFKLGEFDDETGNLTACLPVSLGNGVQFRELDNAICVNLEKNL